MSKESVKEFYAKLAEDTVLQKKVSSLVPSDQLRDEMAQIVANAAKEAGFNISIADIRDYVSSMEADIKNASMAMKDWDACLCFAGGGGYNRTENYSCACVVGGGGKADKDGVYLLCVLAGRMQGE